MTPSDLRAKAEELFDDLHPRRGFATERSRAAELIAEIPFLPGQVLRIEHIRGSHGRPDRRPSTFLSFRAWVIKPDGSRFPARAGFTINCEALPNLAFVIATVLERELAALPAWAGPEQRR